MSKSKSTPRKPTGEIKGNLLEVGGAKPARLTPVEVFKLPEVKNDAEDVVMQKFVEISRLPGARGIVPPLAAATHFPTDHGPDFNVKSVSGEEIFFELLELAPLNGRYEDAPQVMIVGDFIDFVVGQVEKKIAKYGAKPEFRPISLLLYVSHFTFSPGRMETFAIRDSLQKVPNTVFEAIYLELFGRDGSPFLVKMWPFSLTYTRSELTGYRRRKMINADPSMVEIVEDRSVGGMIDVTIFQPFPAGTDLSGLPAGPISAERAELLGLATELKVRGSKT